MENYLKYDVGTNFDYKLFDIINECDSKHRIKNLYGKLKNDGFPGGRNNSIIPDFSDEQFQDYIKECKKNDLTFNYLINPLCMGQSETDPDEGKQIRENIHKLYDIGVRYFTLNSAILIRYVKKEFKDVQVTLGLYAYTSNLQNIENWRKIGVDEVTLDHSFNRNFELLKKLLTYYKDSDFMLRVIANNCCIKDCPYKLNHGSFVGHSGISKLSMDYNLINCLYKKVINPKALITSEWIRPEDIHYYEELARETGNKNFSVKLVDRINSTDFLERVIRAYTSESYDGNLLDIINWPKHKPPILNKQDSQAGGSQNGVSLKYAERINPEFLPKYGRTMNVPDIYIDNKKLDGFIEHFVNHNNCLNSICADTTSDNFKNCSSVCNYCGTWSDKAISYNKEEIAAWEKNAAEVIDTLEKCEMYKKL